MPGLANDHAACLLDAGQRGRLFALFAQRVSDAGTKFQLACSELRVDKLLEPEADRDVMPWFVGLMLDVISMYAGHTLGAALRAMRTDASARLASIGAQLLVEAPDAPNWATATFHAINAVQPKTLEDSVKKAVELGKKRVVSTINERPAVPASNERAETLSYLGALERAASVSFQAIREQTPAVASDAEMLTLFEAFDGALHTVDSYKAAIIEKISRFRRSGATKVGLQGMGKDDYHLHRSDPRRRERDDPSNHRDTDYAQFGMREKKVVRVIYGSGAQGHFGYVHRDWEKAGRLDPDETTSEVPYYGGDVPDEFLEIALAQHIRVWKALPDPFVINEFEFPAKFVDQPDRIVKSRKNRDEIIDSFPLALRDLTGLPPVQRHPPDPISDGRTSSHVPMLNQTVGGTLRSFPPGVAPSIGGSGHNVDVPVDWSTLPPSFRLSPNKGNGP